MKTRFVVVLLVLLLGAATLVNAQSSSSAGPVVRRQTAELIATNHKNVGEVEFWNTRYNFNVVVQPAGDWVVREVQLYAGKELPPISKNGKPDLRNFNCIRKPQDPAEQLVVTCNLREELDFKWGQNREVYTAIHVDLAKLSKKGRVIRRNEAWVYYEPSAIEWKGSNWGWYLQTLFTHPARGHFIDSPVGGMSYRTDTHKGQTDLSGGFDYFPGEVVDIAVGPVTLGSTVANHKLSPLDLFENADIHDARVVNMARFLQSLDADGSPKQGIDLNAEVLGCLNVAYTQQGLNGVDFDNDAQVESLIQGTIDACADVDEVALIAVTAADAKAHLDSTLSSNMFRKNVSKTPELASSKSKLNIMTMWFPAKKADGSTAVYQDADGTLNEGVAYYDADGVFIRATTEAKPVVVVYTDGVEETGYEDVFAGISRDDGNTFKRKNLSRAADKSSFELADGTPYYGQVRKPVFQVKGNNILVAWTSKYCKGGKPAYAIDPEDDYLYDDPYYAPDIWGVSGPQRSVDYAEQDFPEVGEVPYSCVWTARGTIVTQKMLDGNGGNNYWNNNGYELADIVWFKPERLTSGRRDANQIFMGGAPGAGFAIAWQEDPEGLRPGSAAGPGPGWGGATTNHKTDIWYSYIPMSDFAKVDTHFVPGGDPIHEDPDVLGRPKALVPMALPMRISDNDVVNTDNLMVELDGDGYPVVGSDGNWIPVINPDTSGEGTGSHAYGYEIPGLCESFYEFTNNQDALKKVCVTSDGRLLDGDTGASRPNVFLQPYTRPDGSKSAWAIVAYEETKGVGGGAPDHEPGGGPYGDEYIAEAGKNVIYHSFDFTTPDLVSAGNILNLPERDAAGNLLYLQDEEGNLLLDWQGNVQLAYENARRPRFILQGKSAMGTAKTPLIVLYKEGQEGQGRPSDIMLRRFKAPDKGNPYAANNVICNAWATADNGLEVCVNGALNMSAVTPTETWTNPDQDPDAKSDGVKVIRWQQTPENLDDFSWENPYDDARAHRGQIRGDFVVMGFSYTPNWAAARNGHDKYDFFVRRSFDGGATWTTDPAGDGTEHCMTWTLPGSEDPDLEENKKEKEEVCTFYAAGEFEQMRNLSQLSNNKATVIEPRIVAVPGTIKDPDTGKWTGIPEDKQNPDVFYVSFGTSTNPDQNPNDKDEVPESPAPLDLYYSLSINRGEDYVLVAWDVNPDSSGNYAGETVYRWDYLAKGDPEQGEAQLRMTPDGSRFYATWLQESEEGSDIWFRRIMSPAFDANIALHSSTNNRIDQSVGPITD